MSGIRTQQRAFKPRKSPVQSRSRETVECIVQAAAQVFEADGYEATTDRIAERAGVSIGTLYQYFPNKNALLVALAERHLAAIELRLEELRRFLASKPTVEHAAGELVSAAFELHRDTPRLHQILTEEAPIPELLRQRWVAIEIGLGEGVERFLLDSDEVEHTDSALVAHLTTTFVEAMAHKTVLHPPPNRALDAVEGACVQMLSCYLRGTAAPAC
ncbi:MAG: TetR/AcrR family transcriptional regulator [Polyangiaceae bacterium]